MLTLVQLENVLGQSIVTNELTASPTYPVTSFSVDLNERNEKRSKMQQHGTWPTFTYDDDMIIHIEGEILGTDSSDWATKRKALISVLRIDPELAVTDRKQGTLTIHVAGELEDWEADYSIEASQIPLEALSPSRSRFLISLRSFLPYFTGAVTGNAYYWQ